MVVYTKFERLILGTTVLLTAIGWLFGIFAPHSIRWIAPRHGIATYVVGIAWVWSIAILLKKRGGQGFLRPTIEGTAARKIARKILLLGGASILVALLFFVVRMSGPEAAKYVSDNAIDIIFGIAGVLTIIYGLLLRWSDWIVRHVRGVRITGAILIALGFVLLATGIAAGLTSAIGPELSAEIGSFAFMVTAATGFLMILVTFSVRAPRQPS